MRLGFPLVALCSVTPSAAFAQAASAVTEWEFEASLYNYFLPEESDFLVSAFAADRGWLHLEARFNSEALDTGSAWIGYNLGGGDTVLVERTETWHFPSGATPTLRVMCTIELDDDKIAAWREYLNGEELMSQMPPEFFEGIGRAMGDGEATQ